MALSGVVSEIFNVEKYHDLEILVKGQSRSLKVVPFDTHIYTYIHTYIHAYALLEYESKRLDCNTCRTAYTNKQKKI